MEMKPIGPLTVVVMLLLSTTVASVAASGYGPGAGIVPSPGGVPTVGYYGAPSLVGTQESGLLTFAFPDGVAVTVKQSAVKLHLCTASGCAIVPATLTPTASGYSYSFTIPSTVSGSVDVILPAGSLTDQYGAPFPNVDTIIGTFTVGSGTSTPANAGSPLTNPSPSLTRTTNPAEEIAQPQVNLLIPSLLALLSILGVALVAFPNKAR